MIIIFLCIAGCDPSVDLFQENDRHFSVFGYLNASADTQFVRVELLRDGLFAGAPDDINAEVTLTDISTGQNALFKDSLFSFPEGKGHNFYTTYPILPNQTYRLTVQRTATASSGAEVSIPSAFPRPEISVPVDVRSVQCFNRSGSAKAVVIIRGIERLVAVNAIYTIRMSDPAGGFYVFKRTFPHLADTLQSGNGEVQAIIDYGKDLCENAPLYRESAPSLRQIDVVVASGHRGWPDFLSLDPESEAVPDISSNVEGGTGFLGGVVTDTVTIYPANDN